MKHAAPSPPCVPRLAPARAGALIHCGHRGQNAAAARALLDCLARGLPIHASTAGIRAATTEPAPFLFCQSSGSGGRVKTIRRSHASWIASFEVNRRMFGLSARDRYAVLGDLGHSLALYATIEALHLGAGLLLMSRDSPRQQMRQLAQSGVSVLYATPTQLRRLHMAAADHVLPDLALIICGGGKLDALCRSGMQALCPNAAIHEFYGSSEASFITLSGADTPAGSVGRAYPDVHIRIGAAGRIAVAGPYLFDGYAEPDLPAPARDGDFILTGDIGHLDASGHLFLRGRESRMVTVADRNLFLEDVESVLMSSGAGLCAALAIPDPLRGHMVVAVVEGAADDALTERLRRTCRRSLGDHAAPRRVEYLPLLPLLPSGKPDLAALARMFAPAS